MKTNKAKKRGKFPFPVIILALLGGLFLGSINLISGDSWIDGGAYIYPNSSLSNNVNVINGTLQVMNIPVCLMDGTNCPNMTGNSSQGPAGTNGTNGLNGTGIKNIYVLSNGSIVVNLTNGTNIISGNLTGPKGDTGSTGSQGPAGTNGTNASVISGDTYINITSGVVKANLTAFDARYPAETAASIKALGFNITTELKTYFDSLYLANTNSSSNAAGWTNTTNTVYLSNNATNVSIGSAPTLFVDTTNKRVSISNGNLTIGNGSISVPYLKFVKGNGFPGGVQFLLEDGTTVRGYVYMDAEEDVRLKGDDIYFEPTGKSIFTTDVVINRSTTAPRFDMYGGTNNYRMQLDNNSYLMSIDVFPIGNNDTAIRYWRNVNTTGAAYIDILKADGTANSAIRLRSNGNSWLGGGNVGIGTQTPTTKLDVNGSANVTGEIYIGNAVVCRSDGTNCPSGGNSSWNQSGYWNNASASFYPLKTNPQGFYNSSTIPAYVLISSLSGAVGQNLTYALINTNMGNWSADKASYATNVHVANVNATALKNDTVASLAGLTVTSDATVEGVLVVYPGTATAAAVRVGGPLTTYSTLQFQSEQNRTRDFIFSSVNNSVVSNRMAFRVSGNEAGSNSGGDLSVLRFDDSGGFIDTVMKIDRSDGFVGIGDSTPDAKLDVFGSTILDGEVNSTGHIRADGNSIPLMTAWVNKTIANQTVTGTTLANINDLGWLAEANKNYTFDCSIYYRSNTTTNGISFAIEDTGGTVTRIKMGATIETVSSTTVNSGVALAVGTKVTSTAVQAVNTPYQAFLTGTVINGGSAVTINPQFSAEVASLNSTIVQDSWCEVRIV